MPEAGFEPSSADYNTTAGERIQHDFGSFSPGKARPARLSPPCADFLNCFPELEAKGKTCFPGRFF